MVFVVCEVDMNLIKIGFNNFLNSTFYYYIPQKLHLRIFYNVQYFRDGLSST